MPLFTSEISYSDDYPTIEPSLKLDFANSRALDPRITFTRASRATYIGRDGLVKYASDDEARFDHDPTTGESLGLLIEEGRTNLLPQSQQYTSTYWNDLTTLPTGWTTTAGPAPDGSNTVTTWNSGTQIYETNVSYSVGPQYTASVFVKDMTGGGGSVRLGPDHTYAYVGDDPRVTFQPSTQSFTTVGSGVQGYGYYEYPNGWYRVWFKYTLSQSDNIFNIVQLGAYNIGIWGAQIEAGSFPTSYFPTSGASAARAEEQAYMTGESFSSWYNPTEGSVVMAFNPTLYVGPSDGGRAFRIDHQTISDNRIDYVVTANGGYQPYVAINGVAPTGFGGINGTPFVVGTDYKISVGFAANDYVAYKNGTQTLSSTTPASVPIADRLSLGLNLNGHRKSFYYYPKRLTNTQLQTLTQ